VYVTGCDLKKAIYEKDSRNYKTSALSDSYVNILPIIKAEFPEVCEIERFQTAKVTFKVAKGPH